MTVAALIPAMIANDNTTTIFQFRAFLEVFSNKFEKTEV